MLVPLLVKFTQNILTPKNYKDDSKACFRFEVNIIAAVNRLLINCDSPSFISFLWIFNVIIAQSSLIESVCRNYLKDLTVRLIRPCLSNANMQHYITQGNRLCHLPTFSTILRLSHSSLSKSMLVDDMNIMNLNESTRNKLSCFYLLSKLSS